MITTVLSLTCQVRTGLIKFFASPNRFKQSLVCSESDRSEWEKKELAWDLFLSGEPGPINKPAPQGFGHFLASNQWVEA